MGYLYSVMSVGSLAVTLLSGWNKERRAPRSGNRDCCGDLWHRDCSARSGAFAAGRRRLLVLAGAADMESGLFRMTICNETIPSAIRGRTAGIELLSYMTGPLLGNARAGFMAERLGVARSIGWGGLIWVAGVVACIPIVPAFWRYRKSCKQSD